LLSLLIEWIERGISRPGSRGYYGANQTTPICCSYYAYRTTDIRIGLEHPRSYALGAIAYQVLQQENPMTIEKLKLVLEKHPWYASQWQARLQDVPVADRDMVLFMQAV
jgi:hypothetical protein